MPSKVDEQVLHLQKTVKRWKAKFKSMQALMFENRNNLRDYRAECDRLYKEVKRLEDAIDNFADCRDDTTRNGDGICGKPDCPICSVKAAAAQKRRDQSLLMRRSG